MNFQQEYMKCFQDKTRRYFIENYLSTFSAADGREIPFSLFPRQIAFLNSLAANQNTIAIKPRQSGITTVSSGWIAGQLVFASKKAPETVLCIGNKLDISEQLVEKIGNFLDQVPRWMWGSEFYSPDKDSQKNTKSIYKKRNKNHIELFNGCRVYARSSGEHAARGISAVSILVVDEAAFLLNGKASYSAAKAASASCGDRARCIMVSTPNGRDELYYQLYSEALKGNNNFTPVEFRWYQDPRYNKNLKWYRKNPETNNLEWDIDTVIDGRGNVKYDEERWYRLERTGWKPTSPWYIDMCKSFNNDTQKIAQELDVSFLGSADNVIPAEYIEAQQAQNVIILPDDWELKDPLIKDTWIWKDPIEGHRYICAVDSSSGASEDRTAIEILDIDAIDDEGRPYVEQVLEYYGKMTGDEIGEMVYQYANMYNQALVVCDAIGGYSDAAILTLMRLQYPNLYYDDPGLKTYTVQQDYLKFGQRRDGKLPGFRTNSMRIQMLSNFAAMVKSNGFKIRSTRVISELETWIWKGGRPDHQDGAHDDAIYCLAMALFVMQFSMLKLEKQKKQDIAIMRSWRSNRYGGETSYSKPLYKDGENMIPKKLNPFADQTKKKIKTHMIGCAMLGGFGYKKN